MATTKRPVARLNVGDDNMSKYLNQMTFKGIVQNNNPYDVDQQSLKDALNVYVDDNGTLISRPPIVVEPLPPAYIIINDVSYPTSILRTGYTLVDIFETGEVLIYVGKNVDLYDIIAVQKSTSTLSRYSNIAAYHLSAYEHYIVLFNNVNAMVLNINEFDLGWRPIREFAEIPVTNRVVGQESFIQPGNQFTADYKEEYVMSDDVISMIPEGTAEVEVTQSPTNKHWTLENANINPEFRILRSLGISVQSFDLVTTANNINTGINVLCIARFDHVMISLDYGLTFEKVLYPVHNSYCQVASISKDGLYFFFVAQDGVYRYSLGDREWVVIRLVDLTPQRLTLDGIGINNACCFLNGEVFTFALYRIENATSIVDVYWQGPGLHDADFADSTLGRSSIVDEIYPDSKLTKSFNDCISMSMSVREVAAVQMATLVAWLPAQTLDTSMLCIIAGQPTGTVAWVYFNTINKRYGSIFEFETLTTHPVDDTVDFLGVRITAATINEDKWYKTIVLYGIEDSPPVAYLTYEYFELITDMSDFGAPVNLDLAYLVDKNVCSVDGTAALPLELAGAIRSMTISIDKYFYVMFDDILYTNKLTTSNTASMTFIRRVDTPYTQIPTISYTGAQLFLGFGNTLMITDNVRDGDNVLFSLPEINNHSFMSSINGLLNVSTTEVAAFLINKVYIITKVADDLLGYRYDYLSTRLSVGIRPGDSVINTMDGKLTLYPTVKGLAVMNYQPDVASTDQVVDYLSNNIRSIWNDFYLAGVIKAVQMKDYIYLSNGTTTYLMLDLRGLTWWLLTSPFPITKIVTDQIDFNIISNGLYKYEPNYLVYKDVVTRDIEWSVESQPNHFGAPTYYKNLKQLIFQLEESVDHEQTVHVQIVLYRKHFALKDPEIISFAVECYRTFVKRFNYWKINEMQWVLSSDVENVTPAQLKLNGLSIKYEVSEEVRS